MALWNKKLFRYLQCQNNQKLKVMNSSTKKIALKGPNGNYLNKQMTAFNISPRALGPATQYIAFFDIEESAFLAYAKNPIKGRNGNEQKANVVYYISQA